MPKKKFGRTSFHKLQFLLSRWNKITVWLTKFLEPGETEFGVWQLAGTHLVKYIGISFNDDGDG